MTYHAQVRVVDYWPEDLPEVKRELGLPWREMLRAYDGLMMTRRAAAGRSRVKQHNIEHNIEHYVRDNRIGWIRFSNGRVLVRAADIEALRCVHARYGIPLFPPRCEDLHSYAELFGVEPNEDGGLAA